MPNYAQQVGEWLLQNVAWILLVGGLCTAGFMGIKRNVTGALITLGITALLFFIALNAEAVIGSLGTALGGLLGL